MTRAEREAFSDGALAWNRGVVFRACPRRALKTRKAWIAGFEDARRRSIAANATPEQIAESREVIEKLKSHFRKNLRPSAQSADSETH